MALQLMVFALQTSLAVQHEKHHGFLLSVAAEAYKQLLLFSQQLDMVHRILATTCLAGVV
jgi:hypothetical protein